MISKRAVLFAFLLVISFNYISILMDIYLYLTSSDKSNTQKMITGQHLRELREEKGLLLRQVAAFLEVDTAYISKMERGAKYIKREFILKLAELYKANEEEMLILWLADQLFDLVKNKELRLKALKVTELELLKISNNQH